MYVEKNVAIVIWNRKQSPESSKNGISGALELDKSIRSDGFEKIALLYDFMMKWFQNL